MKQGVYPSSQLWNTLSYALHGKTRAGHSLARWSDKSSYATAWSPHMTRFAAAHA